MNNQSSGSGVIIGVLILVVIIVGWLAYSQGFFDGADKPQEEGTSLEINLGGASRDAQ